MLHNRTPEEYPANLGLTRPAMLRADFDKEPILRQAELCHARHGYVQLLTFWGIGWKPEMKESDRLAMGQLGLIAATLQNTLRKGVRLALLLGDNHAWANEIPKQTVRDYAKSVTRGAAEFNFKVHALSGVFPVEKGIASANDLTVEEQALYAPEQEHYEKSARHLNPLNPERRARRYFFVRYREREAIATHFPEAILLSADILQRSILTPPLPVIYIHLLPFPRLRKLNPWFLKNF